MLLIDTECALSIRYNAHRNHINNFSSPPVGKWHISKTLQLRQWRVRAHTHYNYDNKRSPNLILF